ncbi:MAG: AtpZ/AtpI family protein [Acidimicrobiales bacterium]
MDAKQPALTEQLHSSNGSLELVLSAVLFGLIGLWLDNKLGTTPIFLLVFTFLGFAGAAISVYYRYRHDIARLEAQRDAARLDAQQVTAQVAARQADEANA